MHASLTSRLLDEADYDERTGRLTLFLSNGQIRVFSKVPKALIDEFFETASPGHFYMDRIRKNFPNVGARDQRIGAERYR